ncbi:MAG: dienelactone hydrolase family protein [Bacteroidia bacterium]|nr:dienelactone hydrolase family protein [Bacteroidia bacterium]
MNKLIVLLMIFNSYFVFGQNVLETKKIELSNEFNETVKKAIQYKDSSIYQKIEILENGLINVKSRYEKYRIIFNSLGPVYTSARQYDKAIDLWIAANKEGIFFPFDPKNKEYLSYLQEYTNNKRFLDFISYNNELKNKASDSASAEYYVCLPSDFHPDRKYPLIIILHGGIGDNNATYINWDSELIRRGFISVYPRGRVVVGSFARRYGSSGVADIKEVYDQVVLKYPVDTSKVILAGQSAGGELSIRLAYTDIRACGLLLAFPVKPGDFDDKKAIEFKNRSVRIVMICGEKDESFFPGQQEMSVILNDSKVENRFIKYSKLGHGFPDDFSDQIDKGLLYLTKKE